MPFCGECHTRFHVMAQQAGLNLEYTGDPIERIRRALSFIQICAWMLLEQMKKEIQTDHERVTQLKPRKQR
jgi:hypothetical protein